MTRQQVLRAGIGFVTDHPISGPLLLGAAAGIAFVLPSGVASVVKNAAIGSIGSLAAIAAYVSTAGLGAVIRRGGLGRAGFLLASAGMVAPLALAVIVTAQPAADGGCSSCVADTVVFAGPVLLAMLLTPMAIGYWRAGRLISKEPVG